MKVIQKLHQMNLTDMLKDISEAVHNDVIKRCMCEILWSDVLGLEPQKFNEGFCKDLWQFESCSECHQKCLEALMEKDI